MQNITKPFDEAKLMPQINKYADRCITNSCIKPCLARDNYFTEE